MPPILTYHIFHPKETYLSILPHTPMVSIESMIEYKMEITKDKLIEIQNEIILMQICLDSKCLI
jgi:hypothetical protein